MKKNRKFTIGDKVEVFKTGNGFIKGRVYVIKGSIALSEGGYCHSVQNTNRWLHETEIKLSPFAEYTPVNVIVRGQTPINMAWETEEISKDGKGIVKQLDYSVDEDDEYDQEYGEGGG
jgi:hypothetical protein